MHAYLFPKRSLDLNSLVAAHKSMVVSARILAICGENLVGKNCIRYLPCECDDPGRWFYAYLGTKALITILVRSGLHL